MWFTYPCGKNKPQPLSHTIHKNFKEIIDLDVQPKMIFF